MNDVHDSTPPDDLVHPENPGRRREDSVSYSLGALVAKQSSVQPAPLPGARAAHEEPDADLGHIGLVDLSKLGELPEVVPEVGLFPLFGPELTPASQAQAQAQASAAPRPVARRRRGAALVGVAMAVVGVVVAAGMLGSAEARGAAASTGLARVAHAVAAQHAAAAQVRTAPPAEPVEAASTSEPQAADAARPQSPTQAPGSVAATAAQRPATPPREPPRKAPPAAPQRKADACGGDLMCAMRRAAGR